MSYHKKYIKYNTKNKKIINFIKRGGKPGSSFGEMIVDDEDEINALSQYGILTHDDLNDDEEYELDEDIEINDKFFISCHGSRIDNPSHSKIRVPENFIIYFQVENGETCTLDDYVDKIPKICYNDEELLSWFKNVSYGSYADGDQKPEFWNRRWVNKHVPGSIINDCLLSGNEDTEVISSTVVFCSNATGGQILWEFSPSKEILLSKLLILILQYIKLERIAPPHNIFCSFCLNNDNIYREDINQEQLRINQRYPQIYTLEGSTNPVDY